MIIPVEISEQFNTERTIICKYRNGDSRLFYKLIDSNRDRLIHSFPIILSTVINEINAELFIRSKSIEWTKLRSFTFAIWNKNKTEIIGHISIKNIDWVIPRAELAYFLSAEYEGKVIMTEVLKIIISLCFEQMNMNKLYVRVITSNDKSYKVAEKCGFTKEGVIRNDLRTFDSELVDLYYYGLTQADYKKLFV